MLRKKRLVSNLSGCWTYIAIILSRETSKYWKIYEIILLEEEYFMETGMTREEAIAVLKKYNQESFHLLHALTVRGCNALVCKGIGVWRR